MTVQALCADTSLHTHDVVFTLMLLGFLRKSVDNRFVLAIDWQKVEAHMAKVEKALKGGTRINLEPDALRWTPVVSAHDLFRSPYKSPASGAGGPASSPLRSPGGGGGDQAEPKEDAGTPAAADNMKQRLQP